MAGLLIGAASGNTAPAFFVNAASFAFTIGALPAMRAGELRPEPAGRPRARASCAPGLALHLAASRPDAGDGRWPSSSARSGFNYQVTIALMAREVFGLGAEAFGLLSTAFAVGSLTGALLSTRRSIRPRQRFLVVSSGGVRRC